jgi:hypothetical protein
MGIWNRILNLLDTNNSNEISAPTQPLIRMGRYSDNNKSLLKTNRWYEADNLFKEKKIDQSIEAVFDYMRDEQEDNVQLIKETNNQYSFKLFQGTKIVYGSITANEIEAKVSLAEMPKSSIPVMRRLLELNYSLFYSRYALQENKLCMIFDTPKEIASPSKLYYGLKELATKADKQDDLLVTDFASLKSVDDSHVVKFSDHESEVKYRYFKKWIDETISKINTLNQDSFSGGIGYMLLALIYKIDFLITPEGKLLNELEAINNLYWANKEEKTSVERNQLLKEALIKIGDWQKEDVLKYFYRAKSTFAITAPKPYAEVADSITNANENTKWYIENNHHDIALQVMEYGIAYCQFSFSLPRPITQLFTLFMQINSPDYFNDLGMKYNYVSNHILQTSTIKSRMQTIINNDIDRYPKLHIQTDAIDFNTIIDFNLSFLNQIAKLNLEAK